MDKLFTPVNLGVIMVAILSAVGWYILDQNSQDRAAKAAFRDEFAKIVATNEEKTGVVCHDCWLHELNRDHTVPVDIKRYIVDIPRLDNFDLTGSDLTGSYFTKAIITNANLTGATLDMALMDLADLSGADLTGASMRGANMRHANLTGANLMGADLSPKKDASWLSSIRADFEEHGGRTDLKGAVIKGVNFTNANLTDVMMLGAKGTDSAIFCNTTMPDGTISNAGCK
jgi:uncharacterized protein YjbI with pentapeptide repeats